MKKSTSDKLLAHLQENGKDRTWPELDTLFKAPYSGWAKTTAQRNGWYQGKGDDIQHQIEDRRDRVDHQRHKKDKDHLLKQILDLRQELEIYKDLEGYRPRVYSIPQPVINKKGEATAFVQWSDWHLDERVKKSLVGGLNEFNDSIAVKRCATLFENTIKLTDTQRSSVDIPNLVLHLGGDFIGGYLHPELEQTNTMGPIEATMFAIDQISTGIDYLRRHGKFKNIVVVTNRGNHGRLTKKMQFNNDHALNFETAIYCQVKKEFAKEKNISFHISESELNYFDVYGKTFRFLHGHQIRFKGGIGGLSIPTYKALHRWNDTRKSFYTFICDKHTLSNPTPDSQINGSLKGYDAYAMSHGFSYQPPLQSFTLMDSKRGITIKAPIHCI